jgi:hypothetical protein
MGGVSGTGFVARQFGVAIIARHVAEQADGRQQARAALRQAFAAGGQGGARAGELAVVGDGLLINLKQIYRLGVGREKGAGDQQGDNGFAHYFLHGSVV